MPAITDSVEIARTPQEVFDFSADPDRRQEWQDAVREITVQTPGPPGVGTLVRELRQVPGPGGPRTFQWEITAHEPPTRWSFRGLGGPIRPFGTMRLSSLDGGSRTRAEFEIDFEGHGLGKLFTAMTRRGAPAQVRSDMQNLKRVLEARGADAGAQPPGAP